MNMPDKGGGTTQPASNLEPAVERLLRLDVGRECAGVVQSSPELVTVRIQSVEANPTHYLDHACFPNAMSAWFESLGVMEHQLKRGKQHLHMLYTFRSVSRAIPMISDVSKVDTEEVHKQTFHLLRPEMGKIRELLAFTVSARVTLCEAIKRLVAVKADRSKHSVPEAVLVALVRLLDLLQRLDNLKDIKSSLSNDFARFKRAWTVIKATLPDDEVTMIHDVALFLTHPKYPKSQIMQHLRTDIKDIPGHEDALAQLLDLCQEHLTSERFLLPEEKYVFLRAMPALLWFIDGDYQTKKGESNGKAAEAVNVFRHRGIKLQGLQEVFKRYPVVPQFADMTLSMIQVLEKAPHFEKGGSMGKAWGAVEDERAAPSYDLSSQWRSMKDQYDEYLVRFLLVCNGATATEFNKSNTSVAEGRKVYEVVLQGLRLLQRWCCAVHEFIAWKSTHPCSTEEAKNRGVDLSMPGVEYACVGKYNYSQEDLSVLVDVISMCKSLGDIMSRSEAQLGPLIRLYWYNRVQTIIQQDLVPVLHRVNKFKGPLLKHLLDIRNVAVDWKSGTEPVDDYKKYRRAHGPVHAEVPARAVSLSMTQLQIVRSALGAVMGQAVVAGGGGCLASKRDMAPEELPRFMQLYEETAMLQYVLDYRASIEHTVDFSALWYREFYLELTRQVQFPIDMSLPWILTEHVLQHATVEAPLMEKAVHMLDIYNDAARRALYVLNKQFLYDEVEAEVNLVFDQFTFMVSDDVYAYSKNYAASRVLDKAFKRKLDGKRNANTMQQPRRRLHIPVLQRHLSLLGRSVDLNRVVTDTLNDKLLADVDLALRRFESQDGSAIGDLELALCVLRATHELLSEHLGLRPFDAILSEANLGGTPRGRLATHCLDSIVSDLLPNFGYNMYTQRFTRSPSSDAGRKVVFNAPPRGNVSSMLYGNLCHKAFDVQARLLRGYFGQEHVLALVRLVGPQLPAVLQEIRTFLEERLLLLRTYAAALQPGIQPCKLPKFIFKSSGAYAAFETLLKPLVDYQDVKKEVFQLLREIGNCMALFTHLSDAADLTDVLRSIQVAPFVGVEADGVGYSQASKDTSPLARLVRQFTEVVDSERAKVLRAQSDAWQESMAGQMTPKCTLRLVTRKLHHFLTSQALRAAWMGSDPENGVMDVESTKEFHRLWSALSFLFSSEKPERDPSEPTDEENFGHGFVTAGTILVHALGQTDRSDLLDFSGHVLNIAESESHVSSGGDAKVGVVDEGMQMGARAFSDRAARFRSLAQAVVAECRVHDYSAQREQVVFRPPQTLD